MMKLVGYRHFVSKKNNKEYCTATILRDLTEQERSAGSVGQAVEEVFLPDNLLNLLKAADIGKEVILDYQVTGGRAFLRNLTVKDAK